MANAPRAGRDGKSYNADFGSEKQKYFCKQGWTRQKPGGPGDLPVG
jgi:hypothetical protein